MKTLYQTIALSVLFLLNTGCLASNESIWSFKNNDVEPVDLQSEVPSGCSLQMSDEIKGFVFTGRYANYTTADTWYPSWASDGHMYSPWTDGSIHGIYKVGGKPECHSTTGIESCDSTGGLVLGASQVSRCSG